MARRSLLFSPGDRPEMLRTAVGTDADAVAFDLEDAVAPGAKAAAREAVHDLLASDGFDPDAEVCLRVNAGETAAADVAAVVDREVRLDAVLLPKVSGAAEIDRLAALLADAGRPLPVIAVVETAAGVLAAPEIAAADPVVALCLGAEDLAADLGAARTPRGTEVSHARGRVLLAARAAGVTAIDTVFTDTGDAAGLRAATARARDLGYDGKMAIHPAQVPVINAAFTPDPEQVAWAERVLAARAEAEREDRGVFAVDGEMIDAPLIARAERIVARAADGE
jgi:citrate lyase subunit beta/citryl-CoA lyase